MILFMIYCLIIALETFWKRVYMVLKWLYKSIKGFRKWFGCLIFSGKNKAKKKSILNGKSKILPDLIIPTGRDRYSWGDFVKINQAKTRLSTPVSIEFYYDMVRARDAKTDLKGEVKHYDHEVTIKFH